MESKKVKEIKKALEQQGNCGIMYAINNDKKNPCKLKLSWEEVNEYAKRREADNGKV